MPSQTYHLKRKHMDYLDDLCNDSKTLDNPSQAMKYVLNQAMQHERTTEELDR